MLFGIDNVDVIEHLVAHLRILLIPQILIVLRTAGQGQHKSSGCDG
ncbi:hypothetical protein EVA_12157 [gut metagenome]|uniref:Uncharacterized protein n=1 Tax=gut metagenome TaxID=749906 RepID=J9CI55_9ZZZZ